MRPLHSMRVQLGLTLCGLTLLLAMVLGAGVSRVARDEVRAQVGDSLQALAEQMSRRMDEELSERLRQVQGLADMELFVREDVSPERQRAVLESVQARFPEYVWMGVLDPQGRVRASTGGLLQGLDMSERPVFQRAQSGPVVGDVREPLLLAGLVRGPQGETLHLLDISTPIYSDSGQLVGVLATHLAWDWAEGLRESLPPSRAQELELLVVSEDGMLLSEPPARGHPAGVLELPEALTAEGQQDSGALSAPWPEGGHYLSGWARARGAARFDGKERFVVLRQTREVAFAPVRRLTLHILLLGGACGLVFAGLGWWLAGRATRPICALIDFAREVRDGRRVRPVAPPGWNDELALLARSLDDVMDGLARREGQLRRAAEFEQQLIGIVSHDLRTPLNAISLSSTALLRREGLDERATRSVQRIQSSAERAGRMIRDLLDFTQARLGGGLPLERRRVELGALVRTVVDEVALGFAGREVWVEPGPDVVGDWDEDRLAQVVGNLVTNALKYGASDTPVTVWLRDEGEAVRLYVHNLGRPIPREFLSRLFEPLQRALPGTDMAGRSVGLGLYIVDQVVRAHGGGVEVHSSQEAGTTFSVRLPRTVRVPRALDTLARSEACA